MNKEAQMEVKAKMLSKLYTKLDDVEYRLDYNMEELFKAGNLQKWFLRRQRNKLVKRRDFYERCIKKIRHELDPEFDVMGET